MGDIVELDRGTTTDSTPDVVLGIAGRQNWDHCVVIGHGPDGFNLVTTYAAAGDSLIMLEAAKKILMEFVYAQGD